MDGLMDLGAATNPVGELQLMGTVVNSNGTGESLVFQLSIVRRTIRRWYNPSPGKPGSGGIRYIGSALLA